ncbi:MAG: hypothetical protein OK474_06730 [Thaumarchaeota archaeon]|nr:hypothetical protein [Nitrososphaerota archaeon]
MSFWVDPPALLFFGAIVYIIHAKFDTAKALVYAFSGGTIASFAFGGLGLYMDWFRWVIPGIADLKGSYVIFDQGLTGITKATFPTWMVPIFLWFYPFWFILGYELAKRHKFEMKTVPIFALGILLLSIPSVVESYMLAH